MKKVRVRFAFIGSGERSGSGEETSRHFEQLPGVEHRQYKRYAEMEGGDSSLAASEIRVRGIFNGGENHGTLEAGASKTDVLKFIDRLFAAGTAAVALVFMGEAGEDGEWRFVCRKTNEGFSIGYDEVLELWDKYKTPNRHLLLLLDHSYSGEWVRRQAVRGELTCSVQASARAWQRAAEDNRLGGFFIHSLHKIALGRKNELLHPPRRIEQTPAFAGSFLRVSDLFGLRLKFEDWADLRRALNPANFGSWPRLSPSVPSSSSAPVYEGDVDSEGIPSGNGRFIVSGLPIFEGLFVSGRKTGQGLEFDARGRRVFDGLFLADQRHGTGREFDSEGALVASGEYCEGQRHGKIAEFFPSGGLSFFGNYVKGERHGPAVEFFENGVRWRRGTYVQGQFEGPIEEYSEVGSLKYKGGYKDGTYDGHGEQFHPNGALRYRGQFQAGLYHGEGELFDSRGRKISQASFEKGLVSGLAVSYYSNGAVMYVGEFQDSVPLGIGQLRSKDGALLKRDTRADVMREAQVENWFRDKKQKSLSSPTKSPSLSPSRPSCPEESLLRKLELQNRFLARTNELKKDNGTHSEHLSIDRRFKINLSIAPESPKHIDILDESLHPLSPSKLDPLSAFPQFGGHFETDEFLELERELNASYPQFQQPLTPFKPSTPIHSQTIMEESILHQSQIDQPDQKTQSSQPSQPDLPSKEDLALLEAATAQAKKQLTKRAVFKAESKQSELKKMQSIKEKISSSVPSVDIYASNTTSKSKKMPLNFPILSIHESKKST